MSRRHRPRRSGAVGRAAPGLSELTILRTVYFRTPNFLRRTFPHPNPFASESQWDADSDIGIQ
ncbi:hypothetical protein JYU34_009869 [Plutella xylostella]|uniref:Uncharacterized protein n=1 Tax=Plutella xylostella TaxID=51655 RepID=A0ABQ7QKK1_PLUXY|nr:hypothetical protein JYU34_009869 [Plutella xylostella]